ncbi:MAG: class I SAM-dependent methyltransferase [Actinomycetota bacterium]|nr:class I SAM-dependent methyltransferase [Actinomycetota bacterium]
MKYSKLPTGGVGPISNWYDRRVLPRVIDLVCGSKIFDSQRKDLLRGLSGNVLEIGFGSGTNLPYVPASVSSYFAVEPSIDALNLSAAKSYESGQLYRIAASGDRLPIRSGSIDFVLFSFVLCSVDDPLRVIEECARVLKPAGEVRFVEHGRSINNSMARVQRLLDPIEMAVAGNCRLSRVPLEYFDEQLWMGVEGGEAYLGPASPWTYVYRSRYKKR